MTAMRVWRVVHRVGNHRRKQYHDAHVMAQDAEEAAGVARYCLRLPKKAVLVSIQLMEERG